MRPGVALCAALAFVSHLSLLVPSAQQSPTFRTAIDYVEADVVVTDRQNRVVRDLVRDDFEVRLGGRAQRIVTFKTTAIAPTDRKVEMSVPIAVSDVAGNEPATTGRQFVLVIDNLHILPQHIPETRRVVTDFLSMLDPGDQTAVVFTGRSDLGVDFTSDIGRLAVVADLIRDAIGFALGPRRDDPSVKQSSFPGAVDKSTDPNDLRANRSARYRFAQDMLATLRNVSAALMNSPHPRRVLVFISGGLDYDFVEFKEREAGDLFVQLTQVFDDARKANVKVYAIDSRGIVAPETAAAGGPPRDPYEDASLRRRIQRQQQNLRTVAEHTGGKAFVSRGDLTAAVRELMVENGSFYVLGFYAEPSKADGKFHEIAVQVKRPGLVVSARKGYVAPAPAAAKTLDPWSSLLEALGHGLPSPGVAMHITAIPLAPGTSGRVKTAITVRVRMPTPDQQISDQHAIHLGALALDTEGKTVASVRSQFGITVPRTHTGDMVYDLNAALELPKGPVILRVGVASSLLSRIGTVHLPIVVPDLSGGALTIAGPVIGTGNRSAVPAGRFDVIQDLVPFQPTAQRVFETADSLEVFARVFWTGPMQPDVRISIRGQGISRDLPQPVGRSFRTTLPLAGLPSGKYALEIGAVLPGGKLATRSVGFEIR